MTAVDLFAGLGGFTAGAEAAGLEVVWAANHSPLAVNWHRANHPRVDHALQDLSQADFTKVPDHRILLASPACQGFTKARGVDKPHHDACRSTAWAVVSCAEAKAPDAAVVENTPEFLEWLLFPVWRAALEALGYIVKTYLFDAADFGVPQNRVRAIVIASRRPIQLVNTKTVWKSAHSFVSLSAGRWTQIRRRGRARATLQRIARGRAELNADTFLIPYYSNGSGLTGRSLARPIGTVTTRDRWAIVDRDRMRMLSVEEYKMAMGFESCRLPATRAEAIHLLGNAIPPPLAFHICRQVKQQCA